MKNNNLNIEIFVGGDFFGGNRVAEKLEAKEFGSLFGPIIKDIKKSDLALINLESPVGEFDSGPIEKTGPALRASEKTLDALIFGGFDVLTLANNHILDFGDIGLSATIRSIQKKGLSYVGAGSELKEARKIYTKELKNKKIGILNFCENEWSSATIQKAGAATLDIIQNYKDIVNAKNDCDFVLVIFHGGIENHELPSPNLKKTLRFFIDAGADAIISHHTHCVSGYEIYNERPIFYGIGNFLFDNTKMKNTFWNTGMAIRLVLGIKVEFEIIPFKQCNDITGIELLTKQEMGIFLEKLDKLNKIISDDILLEKEHMKWIEKVNIMYLGYLQPYANKYISALFSRKWIPSIISRSKYKLFLNLLRCESHYDVLKGVLSANIKR